MTMSIGRHHAISDFVEFYGFGKRAHAGRRQSAAANRPSASAGHALPGSGYRSKMTVPLISLNRAVKHVYAVPFHSTDVGSIVIE